MALPVLDLQVPGQVYLVTGATRGIGRAAALAVLSGGGAVVAAGRRPESCAALQAETAGYGDRVRVVRQDMHDPAAGHTLAAVARREFGALHGVINNAAYFSHKGQKGVGPDDWLSLLNMKLLGYRSVIEASTGLLAATGGGITNVAGVAGTAASPDAPHVGAVNASVVHMTMSYAALLAPRGIRVNVLSPGATDTSRYEARVAAHAAAHGTTLEDSRAELGREVPLGHPADPAEVGLLAVVMASGIFQSLTGAHIVVDGGSSLAARPR